MKDRYNQLFQAADKTGQLHLLSKLKKNVEIRTLRNDIGSIISNFSAISCLIQSKIIACFFYLTISIKVNGRNEIIDYIQ
jgi:hypothetical protein